MNELLLVIGNKNYSSWSLRPWLALKHTGAAFREERIPLYVPGARERINAFSPSGKVPCLIDGNLRVWDSLAICEYLAERFPQAQLWPHDLRARAVARSVSAEMHAGFATLRSEMGMNIRRPVGGKPLTAALQVDIERILAIWRDCRTQYGHGGDFLFGRFTIADAMFAPVVLRFQTYDVHVDSQARRYMETILALPAMQEWMKDGRQESESIPHMD